jgi:hypothetical protein
MSDLIHELQGVLKHSVSIYNTKAALAKAIDRIIELEDQQESDARAGRAGSDTQTAPSRTEEQLDTIIGKLDTLIELGKST